MAALSPDASSAAAPARRSPPPPPPAAPPHARAAAALATPPTAAAFACDEIDELLSDLLADELPHTTAAGVQAHLASCERCAASYKALKRTVRFVRRHQRVPLQPGTPGGNYMEFSRALVEPVGESPEDVIARATGFRPQRS